VREVSDSLHLRRFCLIALGERVPHESTVRKLTRRLGSEVVEELTRHVIAKAQRETRFTARAMRIDSTVVEADVRYPSDAALGLAGAKTLAPEARSLASLVGTNAGRVRDRSRALGRRLRAISRTVGRRTGERKAQVLALTEQAGELLSRSLREARKPALAARARSRGRGARRKLSAIVRLEELTDRAERVTRQIKQRIAGEPISDRLVSMFDPDARPIRKGKLGKPNEFGYVAQVCELTQSTKRGARGFILPLSSRIGSPPESKLLPATASELQRLGLDPREVALDGGFEKGPTSEALQWLSPSGCSSPGASSLAPGEPSAGWPNTALAPRAGSATSSAATACVAPV